MLMSYHDNGNAKLVDFVKQVDYFKGKFRVNVACRLVRYDKRRRIYKSPCKGNTLLLAAGKLVRFALCLVCKPHKRQHIRNLSLNLLA